jgi:hypothetical protein
MNATRWLNQDVPFDLPEPFSATPPRIDFGQQVSDDILWDTAVEWVACHRRVILKASAPILRARLMDQDDLLQTAHILAVEQCQRVVRQGQPDEFVPLFFGHLRGTCLKIWQQHHHVVAAELDWDNLPDQHPVDLEQVCDGIDPYAEREQLLSNALTVMTRRQRQVMTLMLGWQEGQGTPSLRKAAAWFDVRVSVIHSIVEKACARVSQHKDQIQSLPVTSVCPHQAKGRKQLVRDLTRLERRFESLLEENRSLRRQLGRAATRGSQG